MSRRQSASRRLRDRHTIRAWPEGERPREKLLWRGPEALTNAELLAILLRVGHASTGQTAVDLARALLAPSGSLRRLERASVNALRTEPGMGTAKAVLVKAALELAKRFHEEPLRRGRPLRSSRDVYRHYRGRLESLRQETVYVVLLDVKNRILGECKVSEGSLSASIVHPREVFRPVIEESAAALILVHNHPSGDPTPSAEDLTITERLRQVGEVMGVKVLDHLIIGAGCYASFVERGIL